MRIAGDRAPLEVRIASKVHRRPGMPPIEALSGLELRLMPGEIGAVVGPSGCGKTTLLRIIAGLDPDYDGTVAGAGTRLGMVFQEPRLLPWRTLEDNVRLAAEAAGTTPDLDALFGALDLAAHRARYPGELSLGLARRAAVARAFAVEPELLLLDEPFVSLDEATVERLRDELVALHARSRPAMLVVTHDLGEAARIADRVFVLTPRPGRVAATVPITEPRGSRGPGTVERIRAAIRGAR